MHGTLPMGQTTIIERLTAARGDLARTLEQVSRHRQTTTDLIGVQEHATEVAEYAEAIAILATDHAAAHGPNPWSGWILTLVADLRILLAGLFAVIASKSTP